MRVCQCVVLHGLVRLYEAVVGVRTVDLTMKASVATCGWPAEYALTTNRHTRLSTFTDTATFHQRNLLIVRG